VTLVKWLFCLLARQQSEFYEALPQAAWCNRQKSAAVHVKILSLKIINLLLQSYTGFKLFKITITNINMNI